MKIMYLTRDALYKRYNYLYEQASCIDYRLSESFDYGDSVNYIRELKSEQDAIEVEMSMIEDILEKGEE